MLEPITEKIRYMATNDTDELEQSGIFDSLFAVFQAFLISFTSDFLNKLFYKHIQDEPELEGYIDFNYPFAPVQYYEQTNSTAKCRLEVNKLFKRKRTNDCPIYKVVMIFFSSFFCVSFIFFCDSTFDFLQKSVHFL